MTPPPDRSRSDQPNSGKPRPDQARPDQSRSDQPRSGNPRGAGRSKPSRIGDAARPKRASGPRLPPVSNAKPARHQYVPEPESGGEPGEVPEDLDFELAPAPPNRDRTPESFDADEDDQPKVRRAPKPAPAAGAPGDPHNAGGLRLQKVLAQAGVASRRVAEQMIANGRVEVDGVIVTEQGMRIDPNTAIVRVDGTRVMVNEDLVHLMLNKPRGWLSTMSDEAGRPCVGDIVAERIVAGQRLFHVGRLDADTEGLLLMTNDGELAHRLMHPSYKIPKTYLATVVGEVDRSLGKTLRAGIELDDGPVKVDKFGILEVGEGLSLVRIVIHEGRKHIVRRMMEQVGHPVRRLTRTNIGDVVLGNQRPGTLRVLGTDEVGSLYKAVDL